MGFPIRLGVSLMARELAPEQAAEFESRGFDPVLVADHLFNYRRLSSRTSTAGCAWPP